MPSLQDSYNWAIEKCADANVGYSQAHRNEQTVNGITYYDCSSFIYYALKNGGFNVGTYVFTTRDMKSVLTKAGFKKITPATSGTWQKGDILWKTGHTEMAFSSNRSMGAHTNTVPLVEQVSVNANPPLNPDNFTELYRYSQGAVSDWIYGNRWLAMAEMQNNATLVFAYLLNRDWTVEAISALLGNMQTESSINPAIWQNLSVNPKLGYGLVQWTPSTNYTDWANSNNYSLTDGDRQLQWIDEETVPQGQWIKSSEYPISFDEFKSSTTDVQDLAYAFMYNFERPGDLTQPKRKEQAQYWYNWYNNSYVPPDNPTEKPDTNARRLPIWMITRRVL